MNECDIEIKMKMAALEADNLGIKKTLNEHTRAITEMMNSQITHSKVLGEMQCDIKDIMRGLQANGNSDMARNIESIRSRLENDEFDKKKSIIEHRNRLQNIETDLGTLKGFLKGIGAIVAVLSIISLIIGIVRAF